MQRGLLFVFLATLVAYITCDVSPINPSAFYGAPSSLYGAPLSSYGLPSQSVLPLHKRADELPGVQTKSFQDFNRDFLGSSQNSIVPSVTPPSAELRLPEARTRVDFLSPFSTTTPNSVDISSSSVSPLGSLQSQNLASSLSGGISSSTVGPPTAVQQSFSNLNVAQEDPKVSGQSFNHNLPLSLSNVGRSSFDISSPFAVQQDSFSSFNIPQQQQQSFIGQDFKFNLPPQANFGFEQSISTSPVPSGIDFSAFSTPKPIISEYSNIGINSVPLFTGSNINTNFFNNDAAINSGGAVSFTGKTSAGSLTDAFGIPSSTVSPLADSLAHLAPVGFSQHSQNVQVTKSLYYFAAPEEPEEQAQPRVHVPAAPPKKNYKIIFIKTPDFKPAAPVSIPAIPLNEEKTLIYVLQKKPSAPGDIEVQTPPPTAPAKPEVFFIKYKTEKDAQDAVSQVQEAHADGQVVDNQELLSRFGQNNAFAPQSFGNVNEYNEILARFGTSTPAPAGFQGFGSTTTSVPSGLGFDASFGTSTISPLASFTSTVSPSSGLGNFQFGQNTFESSSQSPLLSALGSTSTVSPLSGLNSFQFGQNAQSQVLPSGSNIQFGQNYSPFSRFGDFNFNQNTFASSTPSPLGDAGLKSFETVSSTVAPSIGSFNSFESSTSSPLSIGNLGLGVTSASSVGLNGFEGFSSTSSPSFDSFKSFESATPSSLGFDSVSSNVYPNLGSFNLGQNSFDTSTPSSLGFKSFESVSPGLGSFNLGQSSFDTSTPSSIGLKSLESLSPALGSFNLGQTSFDTSTPSSLGFKTLESASPSVAPALSGLNLGQNSFESSTPSPLGFNSFEGVSSTISPGLSSLSSFDSSTASPLGEVSSSIPSGSVPSVSFEQKFGGVIPVAVGGSPNVGAGGLEGSSSSAVVPSSTAANPVESSAPSASLNLSEVPEKDNAIATNEVETVSASSRHEVYGPPKE